MKRIIMLVTVALVTVAMMLATAMPALAQPSPYDCASVNVALARGQELTPLQQELYRTYESLGDCIQASVE
jgi:NADH:ubiquinone oxidoreductase subunit 3 (subunit A)